MYIVNISHFQIGGTFLGVSEGLPDGFPQPTVPPEPAGGLSGGEVAAIVVLLTLAAIIATVVGIAAAIYYIQRRRRKYLLRAPVSPNEYGTYLSDTDTFNRATTAQEPGESKHLLESQTMVMMSKEDTLPVQSLVASNTMAIEREAEERAETEEGGEGIEGSKTEVVKGDDDTHL